MQALQLTRERAWAMRLSAASPALFLVILPVLAWLLIPVLFLKPFNVGELNIWRLLDDKVLILAAAIAASPWVWRWSLRSGPLTDSNSSIPSAAITSLLFLILISAAFHVPRVRWFFVEWAKLRTPNPSFARNTLYWEDRNFEQSTITPLMERSVAIVGSSQIYQSTDLNILSEHAPHVKWEKNCLAGFGPMQYLWLLERLIERQPTHIICWLSEFDFFREDAVPINRLRWASSVSACERLRHNLSLGQQWTARGDLADLYLASVCPLWRNRDHIRRTVFNYWWDVSYSANPDSHAVVLAESAGLAEARANLRANIRNTAFVNVNFQCFEDFARALRLHDVDLVVVEGQTHPEVVQVYDPDFRIHTRQRLIQMSKAAGFIYLPEADLPQFSAVEFADGYHLNAAGRTRWSDFLGKYMSQITSDRKELQLPKPGEAL